MRQTTAKGESGAALAASARDTPGARVAMVIAARASHDIQRRVVRVSMGGDSPSGGVSWLLQINFPPRIPDGVCRPGIGPRAIKLPDVC